MLANIANIRNPFWGNVQRNRGQRLLLVIAFMALVSLWPTYAWYSHVWTTGPISRIEPASLTIWFEQTSGQAGPEAGLLAYEQRKAEHGPLSLSHSGIIVEVGSRPATPMTPEVVPSEPLPAP